MRSAPQREAVDMEGAVRCSCSDRVEAEREADRGLSFPQSCLSRKLALDSGPAQRGRLTRVAGLESEHSKRPAYSNFGNRRSLSGLCAFKHVKEHAPDREDHTPSDKALMSKRGPSHKWRAFFADQYGDLR